MELTLPASSHGHLRLSRQCADRRSTTARFGLIDSLSGRSVQADRIGKPRKSPHPPVFPRHPTGNIAAGFLTSIQPEQG
jgi:hypothetical protein